MYVVTCPVCNEQENLTHYGDEWTCNECGYGADIKDMDIDLCE